jgi:hypothetical protein
MNTQTRIAILAIAAIAVFLLPLDAAAWVKLQGRTRVLDFSNQPANVVQQMHNFDALLPGVHFVYGRMKPRQCAGIWNVLPQEGPFIAVCGTGDRGAAWTQRAQDRVLIGIPEWATDAVTMCHEWMHAVTNIGDAYRTQPDTSCVYGDKLTAPGPFDIAVINGVYGKKPTAHQPPPPNKKKGKRSRRR